MSSKQVTHDGSTIGLTDLLFSVLFGATFAFKLAILQLPPYALNPSRAIPQYVAFFAYSILFVLVYWLLLRVDTLSKPAKLVVIGLTILESLAPYPAFDLALWAGGIQLGTDVLLVEIAIAIQVIAAAGVCVARFVKDRRQKKLKLLILIILLFSPLYPTLYGSFSSDCRNYPPLAVCPS